MTPFAAMKFLSLPILALIGLVGLYVQPRETSRGIEAEERLNLAEAKRYLLELINRDRSSLGRAPLLADGIAEKMGQQQSEIMVRMAAMSHADSAGRLPVQRYTEAGGRDRVNENVSLTGVRQRIAMPLEIDSCPTFTRGEIEAVQAAYFNQIAPNDRHRRNILDPDHTHVGLGLARGFGPDSQVIGNAQEFVDRYLDELFPLPSRLAAGETLRVEGKARNGWDLAAVAVSRAPLPQQLDREAFRAVRTYRLPPNLTKIWADETSSVVHIRTRPDGAFSVSLPLAEDGNTGLYYLSLYVRDRMQRERTASVRTVIVTERALSRKMDR